MGLSWVVKKRPWSEPGKALSASGRRVFVCRWVLAWSWLFVSACVLMCVCVGMYHCVCACVCNWTPLLKEPSRLSGPTREIKRTAYFEVNTGAEGARHADQTDGWDYSVCVCECVWMRSWRPQRRMKKTQQNSLTFRELLNRPAGDARRQAPQVEGNGCEVNYLEWDWGFCRGGWGGGGDPCVGGGADAWDWCPVTSPMKLSLEEGPSSSSRRHSPLVLISADRLLAPLCSLTVCLMPGLSSCRSTCRQVSRRPRRGPWLSGSDECGGSAAFVNLDTHSSVSLTALSPRRVRPRVLITVKYCLITKARWIVSITR